MATMELYVTVTADDQPVDDAEIVLATGRFTLSDGGMLKRPTKGGLVIFPISGPKDTTIIARCYPPQGYVIAAGTDDWQSFDMLAGSKKEEYTFKLDKAGVSEPWEVEISDIRKDLSETNQRIADSENRLLENLGKRFEEGLSRGLFEIDDANKARFDEVQKSFNLTNRTLSNISALGPQDGGGGGGGIVDGAYVKKKVDNAVARVLGRPPGVDPYTFLAALRGTFPEDKIEGEIVREPVRTYISMIAESGQLSAAQGALSREVVLIANEAKTVLGTLRSITSDTDREEAEALVELIRTDLDALIVEASRIGRPRRRRVVEILGDDFVSGAMNNQLADLEIAFGLDVEDKINNTKLVTPVEAQLLAAMKLLQRHANTLGLAFGGYFNATRSSPSDDSFSGRLAYTALLLASIGQSTRDLRDTMAAVGLSQAECQTTFITDTTNNNEQISIESILAWIESVADAEGPDMIARSGRLGLERVVDVVEKHLLHLVKVLIKETEKSEPPHPALEQESVHVALKELRSQLAQFQVSNTQISSTTKP